ncbi:MAG: 6-phosphofructokinase [Clostridia bacterium]|nr:6-phosphofructokinase [Clostridia bacterium]
MERNLLIGQSGGPTAAINASLAGVVDYALHYGKFTGVLGSINGIDGVLEENFIGMEKFRAPERIRLLKQTPSSYLGSCRHKLPDEGEVYEQIFKVFEKHKISAFIYIGGNDSMDTVEKLSRYGAENGKNVAVIGVPKTIDNDLVLTDHTPGYGSAAKYIVNSIRQLALDTCVYDMKSVIVAEIMGRNAGWLTAAASLANDNHLSPVDIICLPEVLFDTSDFLTHVEKTIEEKNSTIIAVSEGIRGRNGDYILSGLAKSTAAADGFRHAALGGVGRYIEHIISENLGIKTRSIEFSTLQRCNSETASLCDIDESFLQGAEGARLASEGETGVMVGILRKSGADYEPYITSFDISLVANREKKIPEEMISKNGFFVTDEFIKYASPLISGQPKIIYNGGRIEFEVR